jgi:hypothetical protein
MLFNLIIKKLFSADLLCMYLLYSVDVTTIILMSMTALPLPSRKYERITKHIAVYMHQISSETQIFMKESNVQ